MARKQIIKLDNLEVRDSYDEKPQIKNTILRKARSCSWLSCVESVFPIVKWLSEYQCKTDLVKDVIAGVTIGIFQIPQGMAYGLLGNLDPIVGLYMAFFPGLVYIVFGTSKHNSIGTFAVVCLMSGKPIAHFNNEHQDTLHSTNDTINSSIDPPQVITKYHVAMILSFTVALFHLAMYFLRLGILCRLLSDTFVSAFITGCAIHVLMSQMKDLFGFKMPRRSGYFRNGFAAYDTVVNLPSANVPTVIISTIAILIMVLNNEFLKPYVSKRSRIPIPIELIVVILATIFSYFLNIETQHGVTVVGNIPSGLPEPVVPMFSLMKTVAIDAFSIAIVSYAITVSLAIMFAQKKSYDINPNQELLALGLCNLCGSFFSCMPISAALARSSVQFMAGGTTQLTSLVSCILLLFVLLWIGPLFNCLPRCILASVIVVALKGMLLQAKDLLKFWKLCKFEAFVWLATFLVVAFVDIVIGLAAGVILSILMIFVHSFKPNTCLLGMLPNTEVYLDANRYKQVEEIPGIKIFHFAGGINFITKSTFNSELQAKLNFIPKRFIQNKKNNLKMNSSEDERLLFKCLILDLSAVTYIDPVGVSKLLLIHKEFASVNIRVYLAGASGRVYDSIVRCDYYENKSSTFDIFPSVHDAVLYVKQNILEDTKM